MLHLDIFFLSSIIINVLADLFFFFPGDSLIDTDIKLQVCQLEHQLFDHFFPSSSEDVSSLAPLIDPL